MLRLISVIHTIHTTVLFPFYWNNSLGDELNPAVPAPPLLLSSVSTGRFFIDTAPPAPQNRAAKTHQSTAAKPFLQLLHTRLLFKRYIYIHIIYVCRGSRIHLQRPQTLLRFERIPESDPSGRISRLRDFHNSAHPRGLILYPMYVPAATKQNRCARAAALPQARRVAATGLRQPRPYANRLLSPEFAENLNFLRGPPARSTGI